MAFRNDEVSGPAIARYRRAAAFWRVVRILDAMQIILTHLVTMGKRKRSESWESDASGSDDEHDSDLEVAAELGLLPSAASSAAAGPKVNNVAGLKAALAGMKKDLPWIERLEVVSAAPLNIGSVKDDLKLELAL